jgi:hypothetical protein
MRIYASCVRKGREGRLQNLYMKNEGLTIYYVFLSSRLLAAGSKSICLHAHRNTWICSGLQKVLITSLYVAISMPSA